MIDLSRNDAAAVRVVSDLEGRSALVVSSMTEMELIIGCRNKAELRETETFLKRFQVVQINAQISEHASALLRRYNLSHGLLIPDALIAATALTLEKPLATKNRRDFRFISGLNLLPYS